MKSGISSLNPHAASYIPLSKRVPDSKNSSLEGINKGPGSSNSNTIFSDSPVHSGQGQYQKNSWLDSDVHEAERFPPSGNFASRSHPAHGSSSQNPTGFSDKQMSDMEFEMDMDYLQMSFPGLSQQSIADVYLANKGDLDSAFDMLNHLEGFANGDREVTSHDE